MNIIADTHCHSLASTHAYSTIEEMIQGAKRKGLFALAVTDHGRRMVGAPGKWYFDNLLVIPRVIDGVVFLRGMETNVYDYEGHIDLEEKESTSLDWVVASMHDGILDSTISTVEKCTNAWLNIAKDRRVRVIGHSGLDKFKYDYETVIPEFGRRGKLVEINNSSFRIRQSAISNCVTIAKVCKKHEVPIIVNSDAHCSYEVGCVGFAMQMLEEINFPSELIVNTDVDRFKAYLAKYTNVMEDLCVI